MLGKAAAGDELVLGGIQLKRRLDGGAVEGVLAVALIAPEAIDHRSADDHRIQIGVDGALVAFGLHGRELDATFEGAVREPDRLLIAAQCSEFHLSAAGRYGDCAVAHLRKGACGEIAERVGIRAVQVDDQGHGGSHRSYIRIDSKYGSLGTGDEIMGRK